MEVFRGINGYENYYEISNYGNVKTLHGRYKNCIFKKPFVRKDGYVVINLIANGKSRTFYLHKLVASHFIENDNAQLKSEINHIDGDKLNNKYWNLEWCTPSENKKHAYDSGLTKIGSARPLSKMTEDSVRMIPGLIKGGATIKQISKIFGVSTTTIHHILTGRNYAFLKLDFGYAIKKRNNKGNTEIS